MSYGSFAYGSSVFGGVAASSTAVTQTGLQVTIGGNDYTDLLSQANNLRIDDDLNARRTSNFTLLDKTSSVDRSVVTVGAPVRITLDATTVLFAGEIDELQEYVLGDISNVVVFEVSCVDWSILCDRHVVATRFAEGETLRSIVQAIVSTYSGDTNERLSDDGVTAPDSTVQEGPVLSTVSFNYTTITDAFDDLADLTGYTWYVDHDKRIHFYSLRTYVAPKQLDDATWSDYRDLKVSRSLEKYRNIQYLRAGTGLSNTRTETFEGDDENRTFTTALPVGEKPSITVDATPVDAAAIGIRQHGTDQDGIEWFYEIGSDSISQNSDETVLTSSNVLTVAYKGQYPIIIQARDDGAVDARQIIEGGSGVYVDVEDDESVDDEVLAVEKATGLLRKHANVAVEVSFGTMLSGFRSGQSMVGNIPGLGIAGKFLIEKVALVYISDDNWRYSVSGIQGESQGGWSDFYVRLANKGRPFTIRENESLNIVRQPRHGIVIGDAISFEESLELWKYNEGYAVVGLARIGGKYQSDPNDQDETLDGMVYGPLVGLGYTT